MKKLVIFIVVLAVIGIAVYFYLKSKKGTDTNNANETNQPTAEQIAAPIKTTSTKSTENVATHGRG